MERTDYGWALNTDTGHVFPANHFTRFEGNIVEYTPSNEEKEAGQRKTSSPAVVAHEEAVKPSVMEHVFDMRPDPAEAASSPAPPPGVTIVAPPPKKKPGRPATKVRR